MKTSIGATVENFGRNVAFQPAVHLVPADEQEVLAILKQYAGRTIRAIGRLHSWSDTAVSEDVLLDLRRLLVPRRDVATVGGRNDLEHCAAGKCRLVVWVVAR